MKTETQEERALWQRGGVHAVETQVYGGDVRTMAGGREAGYWTETVLVRLDDGHVLGRFQGADREARAEAFYQRLAQAFGGYVEQLERALQDADRAHELWCKVTERD